LVDGVFRAEWLAMEPLLARKRGFFAVWAKKNALEGKKVELDVSPRG